MRLPPLFRRAQLLPRGLILALVFAIILLLVLGYMSYRNIREQATAEDLVSHTYQVVTSLKDIFASVQDAESAQRMFTMTGKNEYLGPYNDSSVLLPKQLERTRRMIADNPAQIARFKKLQTDIDARLALIRARIAQRRTLGAQATDNALFQGAGVRAMALVRGDVGDMVAEENRLLEARRAVRRQARIRALQFQNAAGFVSVAVLLVVFGTLASQMLRASRAEAEAQRVNVQLRDANNEMRSFSYSVAHDLRSPLRAINGFARVVLDDHGATLTDDARQALERITANTANLAQLIDDLLALSKVSYQPLRTTRVPMGEMVRDVFEDLREMRADRTIEFEVGELPPAPGDPALLRQVWLNLIANALKFTRSRARAHIEIGGNVAGPEFASYFIRDNGAGFDMQYAGKMFGAFQRLHRSGEFEGTGIGLALVQRIIQRHGGTIWAEGVENEGARFAFTLPLTEEPPTAPA